MQTEGWFLTIAKLGLMLVCLMPLTLETKGEGDAALFERPA